VIIPLQVSRAAFDLPMGAPSRRDLIIGTKYTW
jgi:hypothetical protein